MFRVMAVARTRNKNSLAVGGTRTLRNGSLVATSRVDSVSTCDDVTDGRDTDNYFRKYDRLIAGCTVDGQRNNPLPQFDATWSGHLFDPFGGVPALQPNLTSGQLAAYRTSARARTNPSRPDILLPVFWKELADIPRMIRHAGRYLLFRSSSEAPAYWSNMFKKDRNRFANVGRRGLSGLSLAKEAASVNLAIQFGWLPLVSDLKKLANFQTSVERRKKEMAQLSSGAGLRRKIKLDHAESQQLRTIYGSTDDGSIISALSNVLYMYDTWATVRWKPQSASLANLPKNDNDIRRILLGLHPSQITLNLWEALPWSWLTDWFTTFGETLSGMQNAVGAQMVSCCIMKNSKLSVHIPTVPHNFTNGSVVLNGGLATEEVKLRQPGLPSNIPTATFPILSGNQLSILSSLAVMRAK